MRHSPHFFHYIAGLWEGDGHADRKHQTYVSITFHEKDKPFVQFVQHQIGGTIRHKTTQHAYVLTLRKKHVLSAFFANIQHKLRTPKYHDLQKFAWNVGHKDTTCVLTNGWLAGFIDADGGFKIRWTKQKKHPLTHKIVTKPRIAVSFVLEQRKTHALTGESFEPIMLQICNAFGVPLHERHHHGQLYWCVEISGLKKLQKLINYLDRFPLFSAKRLDYEDWKQAYVRICHGEHLTEEGKACIWYLKQGMNRQRQVFCWKHLEVCP